MAKLKVCIVIAVSTIIFSVGMVTAQHPIPTTKITNIVVVGATGDLAQRYLWQGFFNLFVEMESMHHHLRLYGASRIIEAEGTILMKNILQDRVSCNKLIQQVPSNCEELRKKFFANVQYKQLKTAAQYQELCEFFRTEAQNEHATENGRWFYLSVPAFAYAGISENIGSFCRPTMSNTWLRVVLEKPFGHDLDSAIDLSDQLQKHLQENEMFRIDHYLGKTGVSSIMPFRKMNQEKYEKIWNKHHIEKVEIVMKETLDIKGRFGFYNKYGVIRDVMQNHLTEILALVAMEIPVNISSPEEHRFEKLNLMKKIQPIKKHHTVIGQYEGYNEELRAELEMADNFTSLVPTFAGVSVFINSPRWSGVPFILVSGKKMDIKSGYLRIVFKANTFCAIDGGFEAACGARQIIIYTGGTGGTKPMLLVSKNLPQPDVPSGWVSKDSFNDIDFFGSNIKNFYHYSPHSEADAYSALLRACFLGERQSFIASSDLMQSWKIWTPLLKSLEDTIPRQYPGGINNGDILNFVSLISESYFTMNLEEPVPDSIYQQNVGFKTSKFRNQFLKSGSNNEVIQALALNIYNSSVFSIKARGSFHIALSGGKSPIPLFHELSKLHSFPWEETHIWLVDERCVKFDNDDSNFKSIIRNLIDHIHVPYMNVHPMPIHGIWNSCEYEQAYAYGIEIMEKTNGILDYVVLGVGSDGHTASLFPYRYSLGEIDDFELVTTTVSPMDGSKRLSLTLPCLNLARTISILVSGSSKANIINTIKDGKVNQIKLPVTGIKPVSGNVRWYIDDEALIG